MGRALTIRSDRQAEEEGKAKPTHKTHKHCLCKFPYSKTVDETEDCRGNHPRKSMQETDGAEHLARSIAGYMLGKAGL